MNNSSGKRLGEKIKRFIHLQSSSGLVLVGTSLLVMILKLILYFPPAPNTEAEQ